MHTARPARSRSGGRAARRSASAMGRHRAAPGCPGVLTALVRALRISSGGPTLRRCGHRPRPDGASRPHASLAAYVESELVTSSKLSMAVLTSLPIELTNRSEEHTSELQSRGHLV